MPDKIRLSIKQVGKVSGRTKYQSASRIDKVINTIATLPLPIPKSNKSRKHSSKSSRNYSHDNDNYVSRLGLDTVSKTYIEPKPTKIDLANIPLILPDDISLNSGNDYIIVIPSYNRVELIQSKTLKLLQHHKIDSRKIKIFVANKEQHDLYKNTIPATLYGEIIIGVIGLKNQRNFIMNYYPEGQQIVQMDDDLEKIVELTTGPTADRKSTRRMTDIKDLDSFIKRAFNMCKTKGIYLWGVYPLANARFMTPKITTDLRFIVGPMWGMINRHRTELKLTIDEKENAERTLQYYSMDGAVLRFNNVGIETRYYTNKGGMQDEGKNRKAEALKSVYYLHDKYPKLTKIYLGKKSGVPEIKMITPHGE